MTVYIDLMMILNFTVDLLLLMGTNRLSGFPQEWKRLLPAAGLGALYSGAAVVPRLFFLAEPMWYGVFLCLISMTAFGLQESALRRGAVFLLLSLALSGMALALQKSAFGILILEAGALWMLTRVCFGSGTVGDSYIPVTVERKEGNVSFLALRDTGNTLKDPVTGQPVLVVAPEQAELLTGLTREQLADPLGTMLKNPAKGLRLIPYTAVGREQGMLLGQKFPSVRLGNRKGPALLAFAAEGLGDGGMYQALTGGSLC